MTIVFRDFLDSGQFSHVIVGTLRWYFFQTVAPWGAAVIAKQVYTCCSFFSYQASDYLNFPLEYQNIPLKFSVIHRYCLRGISDLLYIKKVSVYSNIGKDIYSEDIPDANILFSDEMLVSKSMISHLTKLSAKADTMQTGSVAKVIATPSARSWTQ